MADLHLARKSGHIALHSSGHLKLYHPGYTASLSSSPAYWGEVSEIEEIVYDENYDANLFAFLEARIAAAVAAMASGSASKSLNNGGVQPAGGQFYHVWGQAAAKGWIYSLSANSGAPFGSPICDLTVTLTTNQYGINGTPYVVVGTGSSAPTGNPNAWSGSQTLTATATLTDFAFGAYVWCAGWFTGVGGISYGAPQIGVSASLSFSNFRYRSA